MRRFLALLIALAGLAAAPAAAQAAWFPAEPIDGPSPDVVGIGGVDLARDGTGALAYLRRDGGVPHVYVARLADGAWRAPQRVDTGLNVPVTDARVAVADGGHLVVAWLAGGTVFGAEAVGLDAITPPVPLSGPGAGSLDADMGINGAGYVVWSAGGDVHAARVQDLGWQAVGPPLDIDPGQPAGGPDGPPRVAVSADGNAVVTWAEGGSDGRTHVYARRVTGTNLSVVPQDLTSGDGPATSPDLSIEDDGSFAWAAFRQVLSGVPHILARRLRGTLWDPPVEVDGGGIGTDPAVAINGDGVGLTAAAVNGTVQADPIVNDAPTGPLRMDATGSVGSPVPLAAVSERNDWAVVWRGQDGAGATALKARYALGSGKGTGPETTLSRGDLGGVDAGQYAVAADRVGNMAVALTQSGGAGRTVAAAVFDRPPGAPYSRASENYQRRSRPTFKWAPGLDLWGPQTYKVFVDGQLIGTSTAPTFVPRTPIAPGSHRWRVVAVDRRGQESPSRDRVLKIDSVAPTVSVRITGRRSSGQPLRISVRARDRGGSGLTRVTVDYGDHSAKTRRTVSVHRYRAGRFTLVARAYDKAGNATRRDVKLRIAR